MCLLLADYDNWKAIDATTGALITPAYTGTVAGANYVTRDTTFTNMYAARPCFYS